MKPIYNGFILIGYIITDKRKPKSLKRFNKTVRTRNNIISQKMFEPSWTIYYKPTIRKDN